MYAEVLNSLFEEVMTMIFLDSSNETEVLAMKYLIKMQDIAKEESPIITYSMAQFNNEQNEKLDKQLLDKTEKLNLSEKKELLKNLDILDRLITVIDPKKDFTNNSEYRTPALVAKKTNVTFKELYEIFIKEKMQETDDNIAQSTWRDYQSAYNDFIYVIDNAENMDISEFTRDDFREFVSAINDYLPSNRTKKKQFCKLSYSKLKELQIDETDKMKFETKKKKISTIKQIFDIAVDGRYAFLEENLAQAFLLKKTKKDKVNSEDKKPLSDTNLKKLFNSKIYTDKSVKLINPEKYWIPLIAKYSGMRQNEICQLKISDIKTEVISTGDTIYYFDLNNEEDKHLKNENAFRFVPIHPKLIELGFIDYYNSVKDKQDILWKHLRLHPTQNRYGTDYSKNFMKFFRKYITTEKDQSFHSLRHNVSTKLLNAAVAHRLPKALINQILGHEPDKDETSKTYSTGYGIEELYTGMKTLNYDGFNIF
jgi:integrase